MGAVINGVKAPSSFGVFFCNYHQPPMMLCDIFFKHKCSSLAVACVKGGRIRTFPRVCEHFRLKTIVKQDGSK